MRTKLNLVDGHVLTEIDGHSVLLDTGSPGSFGSVPEITLLGRRFEIEPSYMGLTVDVLRQHVSSPVDVLVGTDVLRDFVFRIDPDGGFVEWSREPLRPAEGRVPVMLVMGVPAIDVEVAGRSTRAFLDTGAPLSYIPSDVAAGLEEIGSASDFYPGFGSIETPTYRVELALGGPTFEATVGVLPSLLEFTLGMTGIKAIVGSAIFEHFAVEFALGEGFCRMAERSPLSIEVPTGRAASDGSRAP
jgi:hypothetical protein